MKSKKPNRNKYLSYSGGLFKWVEHLGLHQNFIGKFIAFLENRLGVSRLFGVFLFSLLISLFINFDLGTSYKLRVGQLAGNEVKSPISFTMVDEKVTSANRDTAEKSVSPVFDYYPQAYDKLFQKINVVFSDMRLSLGRGAIDDDSLYSKKTALEKALGTEVPQNLFDWLVETKFSFQVENLIFRSLSTWSKKMIYDGSFVVGDEVKTVSVKGKTQGSDKESIFSVEQIIDLRKRKNFSLDKVKGFDNFSDQSKENLIALSHSLVVPNLIYNLTETSDRVQKARENVQPTQIVVNRNQLLLSKGDIVQPSHIKVLNQIQKIKSGQQMYIRIWVTSILFFSLIVVFLSYVKRFTVNKINIQPKELAIMATVAITSLGIIKLFLYITEASFYSTYGDALPPSFFLYVAPMAMAAMLAGLLLSSGELVWLFTLFFTIVLTCMLDFNFNVFVVCLASGVAAARGVFSCEKRNDIYFAGIRCGLIGAIVVFLLGVLAQTQSSTEIITGILWNSLGAFLGGIFSAMFTLTLIPILESFFNITTDVKLLELSNLSHPLMKEMIMKSPGTYHHALAVGNMVEEAANKIQANALLAKVMAYYHDIGKIEHAQYFIENQRPGYNPHEDISPYMSKTVIIAHVKDGAELAIKHKLGRSIVDGILQHHGTTLISYFYNKALELKGNDEVKDTEFRYPGPKPQFKEAALVMLADSIEAAARSIDEPTPAKLIALVQSIIQSKFIDGQLNECNLTFKELSLIEEIFKKTILNIYHHRIDYPHLETQKKDQTKNEVLKFKKPQTSKK